ncbi:GDP dissociation inhibitor-domain-containing protein [Trametes polyzona]|nr:GDP dissociation inhibitor-domain-containing protein [Trametes polyzona]
MILPMDFDVVVLGTGLSESIAAAALSKAGCKVAHVDHNQYYGGDEASLTLDELAEWADTRIARGEEKSPHNYLANQRAKYTSISRSSAIPPQSRQYAVALAPSIVPSLGPHIDSLIASGVSRYGSFKLLEKVAVYDRPGFVQSVPGSKEDVFKSKALSLVEKRRLMRFLMFAAGEFEGKKELEGKAHTPFLHFLREAFSINDKPATAIAYALAFCTSADEPTLPALQRIRQYLRSAGRYGASPFLVGHYGGLGETAQGFCRTSAVKGGTYILGRPVATVKPPLSTKDAPQDEKAASTENAGRYAVELEEFDEPLTAKVVVSSPDYVSTGDTMSEPAQSSSSRTYAPVARCIAIIDKPLSFTPSEAPDEPVPSDTEDGPLDGDEGAPPQQAAPNYEVDTALLVFPPGSLPDGSATTAAHVLVTGEGSMSAPRGKWIVNISLPLPPSADSPSSEDLLRPYLDATLTLTVPPTAPAETQPATPLFTVFYTHHPGQGMSRSADTDMGIIVAPPHTSLITALADEATQNAEDMFWRAIERLGKGKRPPSETQVEEHGEAKDSETDAEMEKEKGDGEEEVTGVVDSFWPPLDVAEVETSEDW